MRVLIVGGDSEVGAALAASLSDQGAAVTMTTRRPERATGRILLDLAAPENWPPLPEADAAVLCAAVSRVEACWRDPEGSRRVNVDGMLALARRLPPRCFTLFLSTNHVLDGTVPRQGPESPRNPSSAYGEQKAEAEERLLAMHREVGVLRFAKVLTPRDPLLRDWARSLRVGAPIAPFADLVNAPAPMDFVCDLIARIIAARAAGVTQAAGDRDLTYAEMAGLLAQTIGADAALVRPVQARRPGSRFAAYPRFASLDSARAAALLGRPAPASLDTVRAVSRVLAGGE